jgi:hypothetical protein
VKAQHKDLPLYIQLAAFPGLGRLPKWHLQKMAREKAVNSNPSTIKKG